MLLKTKGCNNVQRIPSSSNSKDMMVGAGHPGKRSSGWQCQRGLSLREVRYVLSYITQEQEHATNNTTYKEQMGERAVATSV